MCAGVMPGISPPMTQAGPGGAPRGKPAQVAGQAPDGLEMLPRQGVIDPSYQAVPIIEQIEGDDRRDDRH